VKSKYAKLTEKVAHKSSFRVRMGCVIVKGNSVLSIGINNGEKTHPKSLHPFHSLHAEVDAVASAKGEDLSNSTAYVARLFKDNTLGMAKPCQYCETLLRRCGVKEVWYSTKDGWQYLDLRS
jgi:deoxycytidylate deaminase